MKLIEKTTWRSIGNQDKVYNVYVFKVDAEESAIAQARKKEEWIKKNKIDGFVWKVTTETFDMLIKSRKR